MKKVLVQRDKYSLIIWDASTIELENKAFASMFKMNKKNHYYSDVDFDEKMFNEEIECIETNIRLYESGELKGDYKDIVDKQKPKLKQLKADYNKAKEYKNLYNKACKGEYKYIRTFLNTRNDAEYENWEIIAVEK